MNAAFREQEKSFKNIQKILFLNTKAFLSPSFLGPLRSLKLTNFKELQFKIVYYTSELLAETEQHESGRAAKSAQ